MGCDWGRSCYTEGNVDDKEQKRKSRACVHIDKVAFHGLPAVNEGQLAWVLPLHRQGLPSYYTLIYRYLCTYLYSLGCKVDLFNKET